MSVATPQTYATHGHHPVPTYLATLFTLAAIVLLVGAWLFEWPTLHVGVVSLSLGVAVLVSISRVYITRLQDRIIMLEMQVRPAGLLPVDKVALLSSPTLYWQKRSLVAISSLASDIVTIEI